MPTVCSGQPSTFLPMPGWWVLPCHRRECNVNWVKLIAGCDASTWFCWVQHQAPLRILEAAAPGPNAPDAQALRQALLPGLRSGELLAAVAHAHVRRPGHRIRRQPAWLAAGGWTAPSTG